MKNISIKLVSALTWHQGYLLPLAEGLKKRGYTNVETIIGTRRFGSVDNSIVISSFHADFPFLKDARTLIFLEHAVSPTKSAYAYEVMPIADYVLVQGKVFSQWLTFCHPTIKQLKTGWHPIENLYNKKTTKPKIIKRHNLNSKKPIILYLPTWDTPAKYRNCGTFEEAFPILNSLSLDNLLTLPHKSCSYANTTHLDNPKILRNVNTYEYLLACDLIIGDTSSILVESTVLNKPIIQLNKWDNMDGFISWSYRVNNRGKIFKNLFSLFQLGDIISLDKNLIIKTIEENLANPNKYKYLRDYYKDISFYNLGNSLNTTLQGIVQVIEEKG